MKRAERKRRDEKAGEDENKVRNVQRAKTVVICIVVIVIMIFAAIYWIVNSEKLGKRSDLVGDGICGNLVSKEGQNNCCAESHTDDFVIACDGNWEYVSGIKQCQYICEGQRAVCPEDAKQCDDGSTRVRDAENECEFEEC